MANEQKRLHSRSKKYKLQAEFVEKPKNNSIKVFLTTLLLQQ